MTHGKWITIVSRFDQSETASIADGVYNKGRKEENRRPHPENALNHSKAQVRKPLVDPFDDE